MPAASPPQRERRVPPDQALPSPQIGSTQAIGAGVAAAAIGTLAGTAAGLPATAPAVPLLKADQESVEAILKALRAFFVLSRARQEKWVTDLAKDRVPQPVLLGIIADEAARQLTFERTVVDRVRRDVTKALALPIVAPRRPGVNPRKLAVEAIVAREQRYARQRSEAMAIRALAAADQAYLRVASPTGAKWVLGRSATHTAGCLLLAGKVLPWEALDVISPPVHAGCRCYLQARRKTEQVVARGSALVLVAAAVKLERDHGH